MKALLLCAGYGTRLKPLTNWVPKCLAPIRGRPLLDYWIEMLVKSNIVEIVINTHYLGDIVEEYVNNSSWKRYIKFSRESELLGTGGTVLKNSEFFDGKSFIVCHADNYSKICLNSFINSHNVRDRKTIVSMLVFEAENPTECGVVETDEYGILINFHEKVKNPPGNIVNGALYICEPEVLDILKSYESSVIDLSTELIPRIKGKINTFRTVDYHRDIGTIERLKEANTLEFGNENQFSNKKIWHQLIEKYWKQNKIMKEMMEYE
jgi:mannose-1-phosphate guanylyltransferase